MLTVVNDPAWAPKPGLPITIEALAKLGSPTANLSGTAGVGDLDPAAVTPAKMVGNGAYFYGAGVLAAGVIAVAPTPVPASYAAGMIVRCKVNAANVGAVNLNVSALGAKDLFKNGSQELEPGDLRADQVFEAMYDGVQFQMLTQLGNRSYISFRRQTWRRRPATRLP
jgi:hypothetical protein